MKVRLPRVPLDRVFFALPSRASVRASTESSCPLRACRAPLRRSNELRRTADLVLFVTSGRSWIDFGRNATTDRGKRLTTMAEEWMLFRARNLRARLVLIDLSANGMTRILGRPEVLQIGGFSDAMFNVISLFAAGKLDVEH